MKQQFVLLIVPLVLLLLCFHVSAAALKKDWKSKNQAEGGMDERIASTTNAAMTNRRLSGLPTDEVHHHRRRQTMDLSTALQARIVGGDVVSRVFPWFAHTRRGAMCGAVAITRTLLLTVAHCQGSFLAAGVSLGGTERNEGALHLVQREVPHPEYNSFLKTNDIMIVELVQPIDEKVPLAKWNKDPFIPRATTEDDPDKPIVRVIGHGTLFDGGPLSDDLMEVFLPVQPSLPCRRVNRAYTDALMMCIGGLEEGGFDSCQGDSGGPALLGNVVVALVSSGFGCGRPGVPAFYTRVSAFTDWIQEQVCALSPGYDRPSYCMAPSQGPTTSPPTSANPSARPSLRISSNPTAGPSETVSQSPTFLPSVDPSDMQSATPTDQVVFPDNPGIDDDEDEQRTSYPPSLAPSTAPTISAHVADLNLIEITGSFVMELVARFDAVGRWRKWQRLVDFSNGPTADNIVVGQYGKTAHLMFEIWRNETRHRLVARNVLREGEIAHWKVGVTAAGVMFMDYNGTLVARKRGVLPAPVARRHKLLGQSSFSSHSDLLGSITGLRIRNLDAASEKQSWMNRPSPIRGTFFSLSAWVIFDDLNRNSGQAIFDSGNGVDSTDRVVCGQCQGRRSNSLCLTYWRGDEKFEVRAHDAIVPCTLTYWTCTVTRRGVAMIEKDGVRVVKERLLPLRNVTTRTTALVAQSSNVSDSPLDGLVLGLQVVQP